MLKRFRCTWPHHVRSGAPISSRTRAALPSVRIPFPTVTPLSIPVPGTPVAPVLPDSWPSHQASADATAPGASGPTGDGHGMAGQPFAAGEVDRAAAPRPGAPAPSLPIWPPGRRHSKASSRWSSWSIRPETPICTGSVSYPAPILHLARQPGPRSRERAISPPRHMDAMSPSSSSNPSYFASPDSRFRPVFRGRLPGCIGRDTVRA